MRKCSSGAFWRAVVVTVVTTVSSCYGDDGVTEVRKPTEGNPTNARKRSRALRAALSGLGAAALGFGLMGATAAVAEQSEEPELFIRPSNVTVNCETGKAKVHVIGRGLGSSMYQSYLTVKGPGEPKWEHGPMPNKIWRVEDLEVGTYTLKAWTSGLPYTAEATLTVGECVESGGEDPNSDHSWFDPWVDFEDTEPLFVCGDPASAIIGVGGGADLDNIVSVKVQGEDSEELIPTELEKGEEGTFWYVASGLQPGNYTVSMTVESPEPGAGEVTVEGSMPLTVLGCPAELIGVHFISDTVENECPATTAATQVVGNVLGVDSDQEVTVEAELYEGEGILFGDQGEAEQPSASTPVDIASAEVEVENGIGTFSVPFEGLAAGECYAKVTVFVDGEAHAWDIAAPLTVTIKDGTRRPVSRTPRSPTRKNQTPTNRTPRSRTPRRRMPTSPVPYRRRAQPSGWP